MGHVIAVSGKGGVFLPIVFTTGLTKQLFVDC
jgi:hypothetical protein